MKLDTEFYKLPLKFDAARLAAEVSQFSEAEWRAHPQGHAGNSALPLVAVGGNPQDDSVRGPMRPTAYLSRCPYIQQVLASFGTVLGRARLMRIAGEADATEHVDTNYYWLNHVRIHIPAITWPEVRFLCNKKSIHMAAGESWIFDSWRLHNVINPVTQARIHLVADTAGSAAFWELVEHSERPFDPRPGAAASRMVPFVPGHAAELNFESANFPVVMPPWEQENLATRMLGEARENSANDRKLIDELARAVTHLQNTWRELWSRHGDGSSGWAEYKRELDAFSPRLAAFAGKLFLPNMLDVVEALMQAIIRPALNTDLAVKPPPAPSVMQKTSVHFDRPVLIVSAPRSGSTLLFETLARSPGFATFGGESHAIIERIPGLAPSQRGFDSNRLSESDAQPQTIGALKESFQSALSGANTARLLEKTPKNALRIPFLNTAFPDALFIYLYREPRESIGSMIDAWNSGNFVTYPELPGWTGPQWSLLLIPGWRELIGRSVAEIAARQWASANEHILDDLQKLPAQRWCAIRYTDFLADPQKQAERLCKFAGVPWTETLAGPLPLSRHTLTPPDPEKWRRHAALIEPLVPAVESVAARAHEVLAQYSPTTDEAALAAPTASDPKTSPLRSVHTTSLLPLVNELGISLMVSTYQAGKLIVVRAVNGQLNTHFRNFNAPMGLAGDRARLAIGVRGQVWEFHNQIDVAKKLQPAGHDAAYVPRKIHFSGDIQIHEIAWAGEELWIVNTRFSCLCTLDRKHSFVPRWTPNFITALLPEDRCHLNGLAMVNGAPRFVTALGRSDKLDGWRENKAFGGVLIDVSNNNVVAAGLSMPHSPRWYADRLWVLESGRGTLGHVDIKTGRVQTIAEMPGFTRGLDFVGPYAFIGLSQIRETAVFAGLPLTERYTPEQRSCGVWVVDIRNGQTVAFLKFSDAVQEIFAVQALQGIRVPDILNEDANLVDNSFVLP